MKKLLTNNLILLLLLLCPAVLDAENGTAAASSIYYYCPHVIDGDTIIVIIEGKREKVRLIGVDAPETDNPYTKEEPFGKEATAFTRKMTEGRKVRLEYDHQSRDRFGRLLAYVFLDDGTFLNAEIIRQGCATVFRKFPFKYRDDFERYEREARKTSRGIWEAQP